MSGRFPHDPSWDYWVAHTSEGRRAQWAAGKRTGRPSEYHAGFAAESQRPVTAGPRNGLPPVLPYRWRPTDEEREAWVRSMVELARRRARDRIAGEVEAGAWWVPVGFTVADLDAMLAEVYG